MAESRQKTLPVAYLKIEETPYIGGGKTSDTFTASPLEKASQQKQQAEALTREAQEFEKEIEANIEAAKANAKAIEENTAAASAELKEINKTTSANREASLALDQRLLAVLSAQKELAGLAQNMAAVLAGDAGADFPRLTADERGALLENIKNIMYAARESVVSIQEIRQTSNSAEQVPVKVNMPDTGRIEQAMEQTIQAAPVIEKILIELTNNDIQLTAVKSFSAHYDIQIQYAKHLTELSEFAEKQESRQAEAIRQQQKEAYKETLNIYYRALLGEITAEEVKVLKAQRDIISDDWTERNKLQKEINSRESQIKYPLLMTAVDKLLDKLPQELQDFFETMLDSSADIQTVYLALDRTLQKFKETLKSKDLSLDELKRLKDNYADSAEIAKIIQEVINEQQKQLEPAAA
jgi:hypothetical protein